MEKQSTNKMYCNLPMHKIEQVLKLYKTHRNMIDIESKFQNEIACDSDDQEDAGELLTKSVPFVKNETLPNIKLEQKGS